MRIAILAFVGLIFLTIISTFFGSWYRVSDLQAGMILRNGKLIAEATPGLGFKLPFIDSVVKMDLTTQSMPLDTLAYSSDQQSTALQGNVNIKLTRAQAKEIYLQFGSLEAMAQRVLQPRALEAVKTAFAKYTASTAIQQRDKLNLDVSAAVKKALEAYGVVVEGVQLSNIDFSDAYEATVEKRMLAQVEVDRLKQMEQQAIATAGSTRANADAAAYQTTKAAEANATATKLQAEAEAAGIKARLEAEAEGLRAKGKALADNPALVELTKAERWKGDVPTSMPPGSTIPLINVK